MKKYVKLILIVVALLLAGGGYFAYQIYQMVSGSEDLTGEQGAIPTKTISGLSITKGADDWPNWRGLNMDGKSATSGIKTDWSNGLTKRWQVNFLCQDKSTASWSSAVVQGNRLVVPGRDETNDLVFCLNPDTGELIWKASYVAEAGTSHGPGARATPFIDEDRVYTFGRNGDLACWALEDGKLIWKQNVAELGGVVPEWGHSTSPFVFEDKVIVQGGGPSLVIAYDKMTGNVIWKSLEGAVGYSAATTIDIENETMLLIYHAVGLSCINPNNGKELWQVPWATDHGVNATTPIVVGDIVFHTSAYKMGGQAIKVDKNGYHILWKNNVFAAQHSDPVVIDGYVYGYAGDSFRNNGSFKCMELKTGKEIWSTDELGAGTIASVDGHIICQDLKGNLFLVKPNPQNFELVSKFGNAAGEVKHLAWTAPMVANGKLYLRYLQRLICYDLK